MSDMAMKYAMKKRMASGSNSSSCSEHGMTDCGVCMAEGGEVKDPDGDDDSDMIGRIMSRRMAKGGDVEPLADFESNDFDRMDQIDVPDDANYTGANSGDELGNEALDENDADLIGRIMRSRAKKDRMPRPA